jgi:tetratricopeptide (TPR) repeat protein
MSVDHFFQISFTIFDGGAWLYALLLLAVTAAALILRKRAPLATFGFLMFLIWLAPTSSIIPIADPLVERRMYLPMLGLILIACDAASRLRLAPPIAWSGFAAVLLIFSALTWERNVMWGRPAELLASAAMESERNPRPVANLTETLIAENRCQDAVPWLQRADRLLPGNYIIEASWGRTLECLGRREEALSHLQTAAGLHPGWKLYELMGLLHAEMNHMAEAEAALQTAIRLEPNAGSPHRSLALWYEAQHEFEAASEQYRAALQLDPLDSIARAGLARAQAALVASLAR